MAKTLKPGIHDGIPMTDYVHDDISPEPSVTKGTLNTIVDRCAQLAYRNHPKLGGVSRPGSTQADEGSALHELGLGGDGSIVWLDFDNYRAKAAQQERDEARDAGLVPMLSKDRERFEAAGKIVKRALAVGPEDWPFDGRAGKTEQTILWQSPSGVWCRCRPDFLLDDLSVIVDLKTTANADPSGWIKTSLSAEYKLGAVHYSKGVAAFAPKAPLFLFLVLEKDPPHLYSWVALDPEAYDLGNRRRNAALAQWLASSQQNRWPGYSQRIHYAEPKPWEVFDFENRAIAYGVQ